MLITSRLRYALYGAVASASLITLSVSAGTADGVFGEYFKNIINTPCTYGYEVITGFSSSSANYGTRKCTNIATVLGKSTINIGIGTESPAAKLDVAGRIIGNYLTIRPENTTVEGGEILLSHAAGMTKNAHIDNSADRFRIHNGSSEVMTADLSNGNIGIGTATPGAKLEVASTTDSIVRLNKTTGTSWNYMEWMIAGARKYWTGIDNNGVFNIQGDSSAVVAINAVGGNVGIGTTTPGAKLEVAGGGLSMKGGEIIIQRPVTTGGWARGLHYTPNNSYDSTNAGLAGIGLLGGGTTESSIYLTFGAAPWSSSKGIQILANGNVGIGTTTPTAKLQVNGNIQAAGSPVPANWYNLQAGSIGASTVYGYSGICTGNALGDCTGNGGVVLDPAGSIGIGRKSESTTWGMTIAKDGWAMVTRKADGKDNAEPKAERGSIYVNDVYLRSKGKWASEIGGGGGTSGGTCNLTEYQSQDPGCPVGSTLYKFSYACGEDDCGGGYGSASCRYFDGTHIGENGVKCYEPTKTGTSNACISTTVRQYTISWSDSSVTYENQSDSTCSDYVEPVTNDYTH